MRRSFIYSFSCLFFLFGGKLSAQSLSSLLEEAAQKNLGLKAWEQEYASALEKASQSRLLPATQINLGAFALPVETRNGPQRLRLGTMQMFPWFGTLDAKEEVSLKQAAPFVSKKELHGIDIAYQIKLAYFRLFQLKESKEILNRNITLLESLRQLSLSKVEGGKASTADVLRLEIKLRESRQQLAIIEKQWVQPQSRINQLLSRESNIQIQIDDSFEFAQLNSAYKQNFLQLKSDHPAIQLLSQEQDRSRASIRLNEKISKPSWGLGIDYLMVDNIPTADFDTNGRDALLLKASLNIPLQRKPYQSKNREEHLRIEALETRKKLVEDQFLAQIEQAIASHESAQLKYELYEKQEESIRSVIQLLQSDFSHNGERFDELLSLEQDLLSYELKKLEAIVESHHAKAALERIILN
ncbi:MAG: TolC family protein [Bacteroidota bacterium]